MGSFWHTNISRSMLSRPEQPRVAEPEPEPEPTERERQETFNWRVREKARNYMRGGMPANLAWSRAYRALTEPFDAKWGRRMLALRAVAAKQRKRVATLATEKKVAGSRSRAVAKAARKQQARERAMLREVRRMLKGAMKAAKR